MSWIFHSIADEMVRTVNALRVEVGLKILTGFVTKCNDFLSSSPECSCLLSTARNPFTSRVSECLPYYVLLTWSCTPPCPSVISLIANWLMPGFTSALSWAWWSVVWCSSTAGLSQVTSSRKHKWNYTILFQCAYICTNSAFWFILLFTSHARKQTQEWTWRKSFTHCRFKVSRNDYTL